MGNSLWLALVSATTSRSSPSLKLSLGVLWNGTFHHPCCWEKDLGSRSKQHLQRRVRFLLNNFWQLLKLQALGFKRAATELKIEKWIGTGAETSLSLNVTFLTALEHLIPGSPHQEFGSHILQWQPWEKRRRRILAKGLSGRGVKNGKCKLWWTPIASFLVRVPLLATHNAKQKSRRPLQVAPIFCSLTRGSHRQEV